MIDYVEKKKNNGDDEIDRILPGIWVSCRLECGTGSEKSVKLHMSSFLLLSQKKRILSLEICKFIKKEQMLFLNEGVDLWSFGPKGPQRSEGVSKVPNGPKLSQISVLLTFLFPVDSTIQDERSSP